MGPRLLPGAETGAARHAELLDQSQGRSGERRRLSTFATDVLIADASGRGRGGTFTATVHKDNDRSRGMCTRFGFAITNPPEVDADLTDYYALGLRNPPPPPFPIRLPR